MLFFSFCPCATFTLFCERNYKLRPPGDVEEGGAGGAMTNNSHPTVDGADGNNKLEEPSRDEAEKEEKSSHSKDKSVLQAKLTKLAIQIGYAGVLSFSALLTKK